MKAILAVLCFAVLVAVAQAAVANLKVDSNGQLSGFELRNQTAFVEKYSTAGASCTQTFGVEGTQSVLNSAACPNDQVCMDDGGNNTFSCFDCDSSCDCDADSFCLLNPRFKEYGVCVSYKDLLGKTCNANLDFDTVEANTTSIAACTVGQTAGGNTCNSSDSDLVNLDDAIEYNVQIAQSTRYCGVFAIATATGPLATNAAELNTFYPNDALGTFGWGESLTCLDGKCRQCNAYSNNECGGSCNPRCTGSTDENKNLFCGGDHEVTYRPRTKAANPLGLKSSASSTAAGAAVLAVGAAAALLL